jgi:hypothetical protein
LRGISLNDGLGTLVVVFGLLAAALALVALFVPVYEITVNTLPCEPAEVELAAACSDPGSLALLPLGLLTAALAVGAGLGGSRPAAVALLVVGVAILALTFGLDAPKLGQTGAIGLNFDRAVVHVGPAYWMELAAAVLALLAGLIRVLRPWTPAD